MFYMLACGLVLLVLDSRQLHGRKGIAIDKGRWRDLGEGQPRMEALA